MMYGWYNLENDSFCKILSPAAKFITYVLGAREFVVRTPCKLWSERIGYFKNKKFFNTAIRSIKYYIFWLIKKIIRFRLSEKSAPDLDTLLIMRLIYYLILVQFSVF